jgi:hypothetical protein
LLIALVVWAVGIAVAQQPPVPPLRLPFDASKESSSIDLTIRIKEKRSYYFDMDFLYANQDEMPKVQGLAGGGARFSDGRYAEPGIAIPIHLKVKEFGSDAGRIIYDSTVETQGRYAHGFSAPGGHYSRVIAGLVLAPGLYRVEARPTRSTPELSGTETRFSITYDARFSPIRD